MSAEKNKSAILVVIAVIVVCIGSIIGVSAISKSDNKAPTAKTTLTPTQPPVIVTTTAEPEELPAIVITTQPQETSTTLEQITTYPAVTTQQTVTEATTLPEVTTRKPQTTKAPTTSAAIVNQGGSSENNAIFDEGLAGYEYDADGNFYYTNSDPWQRAFGFNEAYDIIAPFLVMYYDTMRLYFDYGDQEWLIQFWKGQYGLVFVGHEIGVYTKPKDREAAHFDCASNEDALYMTMTGYRDGQELYTRDYAKYWWCTGFVPGTLDNFNDRSELALTCRITAKDETMLFAICGALAENGYVRGEGYATKGLDVYITW